jgi:transposase
MNRIHSRVLAYIQAVSNNLPKTRIVFDHFHVIKLYNDKLTGLRRSLYRKLKNNEKKEVLKRTRWLLLKNPENLNSERNEAERLEKALSINKPLAVAYYMKEELRQFWKQPGKASAEVFLIHWIGRAKASGIPMLTRFADTLQSHKDGLLAYYDHPISTGPLEGTNNKIKTETAGLRFPRY